MKVKSLSRVRLLATPWTAAHQAPPSVGFSRQEHWSGVPLPSPFSGREGGTCVIAKLLQSCLTLCTTGTVSHQAPLSMGFSRQEYWSGLPCLPPGDFPEPGVKPMSLMCPALAGGFLSASTMWEAHRSWEDGQMEENINK